MKLYCKGQYHHGPLNLHFDHPGVIEVDDPIAAFLQRDAPENFTRDLPTPTPALPRSHPPLTPPADAGGEKRTGEGIDKALDEPPVDKQIKAPVKKK